MALGAAGISDTEAQYDAWVAKYGQETADMLREEMRGWTQHYTRAAFIDTGLVNLPLYEDRAHAKADEEGWIFERMNGDNRLLNALVQGEWSEEEFLIVNPGYAIKQTSTDAIVKAVPV